MKIDYRTIYSKRKTVALVVTNQGHVLVRAGYKTNKKFIDKFVLSHEQWIENKKKIALDNLANQKLITIPEIEKMKALAKTFLTYRTKFYSEIIKVTPTAIKISSAKTRWGSCSAKNSISYSYRVMLLPNECIDYIIVHELCHIIIKNHSNEFYNEIEKYIPNYKEIQKKIKNFNG